MLLGTEVDVVVINVMVTLETSVIVDIVGAVMVTEAIVVSSIGNCNGSYFNSCCSYCCSIYCDCYAVSGVPGYLNYPEQPLIVNLGGNT